MMNTHERFTELWSAYLEGELDQVGLEELRQILTENPDCRSLAIGQYQVHRALGVLSLPDQELFIRETLKHVPSSSDEFVANVLARVDSAFASSPKPAQPKSTVIKSGFVVALFAVVASLLLLLYYKDDHVAKSSSQITTADAKVRFTHTAQTKFLGAFAPEIGAEAVVNHEYILTSGSIQLQFPTGAEVIVQGPAVFQIASDDRLNVTIGRCSVYCPKGAEGFEVDTPNARVVDRGTRFFINVVESAATEVHVVDGIADVLQNSKVEAPSNRVKDKSDTAQSNMVRLKKNEARTVEGNSKLDLLPTDFRSQLYQYRLPDRVISYQGTQENGGVKFLTSVDVQRGGEIKRYPVQELIASRLTWFKIEEKIVDMRHLAGEPEMPDNRLDVMLDLALNTGAINPGGSVEPYSGDPVFPESSHGEQATTPGFAIEFVSPVINSAGPDVVFFELQSVTGAPDGDPFHVLPLKKLGKRRSITIQSYDLTLTSPESQRPANFYLFEFDRSVDSLDILESAPCRVLARPQGSAGYRVIAVAIDLSAMGFEEGEAVEGLFFQDSLDDQNHIDPVAILGLPSTK
ncbi:MAG: hypothetical protein U0930_13130 [Pirellulales bacterium]